MFAPSVSELLVVLVIVLVIFGAAKLPKLGGEVGQAIRNFKQGLGKDDPADPKRITDQAGRPPA
jgi:sec-independent protein translocase protein TatA